VKSADLAWSPAFGRIVAVEESSARSFDVRTGAKVELPCIEWGELDPIRLHDVRPWAVSTGRIKGDPPPMKDRDRVVIVDFTTGAVVGSIPPDRKEIGARSYHQVGFLPGTEILFAFATRGEPEETEIQLWSVPPGLSPLRRFAWTGEIPEIDFDRQCSRNERLAWVEKSDLPPKFKVMDLRTGQTILSAPAGHAFTNQKGQQEYSWAVPILSPDGSTLLDEANSVAVDVNTGRLLASLGTSHEWRGVRWTGPGLVQICEDQLSLPAARVWNGLVENFFPRLTVDDVWYDIRDARSGALKWRCTEPTQNSESLDGWVDHRLGLRIDQESVRRIDLEVRWGLIALLQAILAAPLVAAWGLLRWRRWRLSKATP